MAFTGRCTLSTSHALKRLFLSSSPSPSPSATLIPRSSSLLSSTLANYQPRHSQFRNYAAVSTARRLPVDSAITSKQIHLKMPDGTLSYAHRTAYILSTLDLEKQTLVTVAEPDPDPDNPSAPQFPICVIVDKQEMRDAERARRKRKPSPASVMKTIELNWAIDSNDLGHRLNKVRQFLGKGNRVQIELAGKRKGRKATPEEIEDLLAKIKAVHTDPEGLSINGWRESKQMDGQPGENAIIHLEGKVPGEKIEEELGAENEEEDRLR